MTSPHRSGSATSRTTLPGAKVVTTFDCSPGVASAVKERKKSIGSTSRRGYLHRLVAAQRHGAFQRGKLVHAVIQHDHWCAIYRGGVCSCTPDISLHSHGGGDVIEIDAEGRAKKSVVS
jgi:hypothetical protein